MLSEKKSHVGAGVLHNGETACSFLPTAWTIVWHTDHTKLRVTLSLSSLSE